MRLELELHYQNIHTNGLKLVKNGSYFIDKDIFNPEDLRRGITLLARPDKKVSLKIHRLLQEIKDFEPHQYFYPQQDFHITIMSIISCYSGFHLDKINIEDYISVIKKTISKFNNFNIHFKGISLNPSGILVNGYLKDDTLNLLRNSLRENFKQTDLEQSLDQRYAIKTAHSSIFRFQHRLNQPNKLIEFVEKHRETDFGSFEVKNVELVFNDWYLKTENTIFLENFSL
ncbi:2'-5' RNA ligase family protein [Zunongwangia pacifica]|uniref:Mutarotase n=1 Tax=Zunongwangia pacifica TaxID=2911062 RepID=A0A9X1ZT62_9FLAO|nr:mutarotase [Zunongwangia pacifica]MCL6220572.1 mutarotase [Zunongwangia pacifica]